jgi:3-hydroxyisobutyrate dehydrogenase and related beta-hydroxyacid dehydrogenases
MGQAFASNLIVDGHDLTAYDQSPERVAELERLGAHAASRLADLAGCSVVLTSVPDDEALFNITEGPGGLLDVLARGAIHLSMSTVSSTISRRLAEAHLHRGQHYVAAPVLGNPDLARARQVFVIAAGPPAALAAVRPLLERLGQKLFVVGEAAESANLLKLAGNVLTATTLQSMGETLALLQKRGIDPHLAYEVFTQSLFDSRVHRTYGGKIVDGRYRPAGMAVPLAVKDLRLALAEAEIAAVPMPVASLVHDRLVAMLARGWADLDWAALGLLAAFEAGLGEEGRPEGPASTA